MSDEGSSTRGKLAMVNMAPFGRKKVQWSLAIDRHHSSRFQKRNRSSGNSE